MKHLRSSIYAATLMLSTPLLAANTLYVDSSGTGTSCSESDPCSSIQAAVDLAVAGDTIQVEKGIYTENIRVPAGKNGLTISGEGHDETRIVSAGGIPGVFAPPAPVPVPADIIFDVFSADVTIEKMTLEHPAGSVDKRDIGVFVRPPAANATVSKCALVRNRSGELEFGPGSRGILVFRAAGSLITKNRVRGFYEDGIHIPAPASTIMKNDVDGSPRIGIVIIQEAVGSNSRDSLIYKNEVSNSGSDGIQIQGDNNEISKNEVENNGGAGIKLCGTVAGDCVGPGDSLAGADAIASGNTVSRNELEDNNPNLVDNGENNTIDQ